VRQKSTLIITMRLKWHLPLQKKTFAEFKYKRKVGLVTFSQKSAVNFIGWRELTSMAQGKSYLEW
jgi:NADH dehydrogenase FAD-containing subunit